ncbi:MAG TPA: tRNA pseudouridine(13) synthase TruD [Leucothrix sp.]|nr:tRNA pseudouridine(13) synthase TruD [Leucothrix sp.]
MKQFQKVNSNSSLSGIIRSSNEDFIVDEIQVFNPSGQGEHVWLKIKKTGENTDWVAGLLAKIADVPRRDVSFAGMKDRNAVTTQWFSVQMPGREAPDWQAELPESIQILEEKRHDRKLRRGTLEGNTFKIIIRQFKGSEEELKATVKQIKEQGIPNYFGEQRFGFFNQEQDKYLNIIKAEQWFKGEFKVKSRPKRSIYLSAARSWIFNHILSERVKNSTWNQAVTGDVFMLDGSKSCFTGVLDDTISERIQQQNLHLTGALWGKGELLSEAAVADAERAISIDLAILSKGLEDKGLKQERKALRLRVQNLSYEFIENDTVCLQFSLPAGAFATSVLSEIGAFSSII